MKTALVTGATGFIGRHALAALAARGFEVHAVTSRPLPHDQRAHWHRANLMDEGVTTALLAEVRPTHLLHLAWDVSPGRFWESPENLRWLRASLLLAQTFAEQGGRRLVGAGTCAEYDWRGEGLVSAEGQSLEGACGETTTPLRPATLYGASKRALHLVLEAYARTREFSVAWGRVFLLYGPHEPPPRLVPAIIRALLCRQDVPCSRGNQVRDLLHVEDVAAAFAALLDSDVTGAVNVASGVGVSVREIVDRIARALDGRDLVRWGALPGDDGPPHLVADVSRLNHEVGWRPAIELGEGLSATIAWWRERLP